MTHTYSLKSLLLGFVLLTCSACGDFLEEQSQGLFIPRTAADYLEFVAGEALNLGSQNGVVVAEYLDLLTDDIEDHVNTRRKDALDERERYWGYYTWQADPEIDRYQTVQHDAAWGVWYHRIFTCNMVLDKLPGLEGEAAQKIQLEAEARFIRAWSYFCLVNTYADPYESAEQAAQTPGVPLNESTSVENVRRSRASLQTIYQHIEADLQASIGLFEQLNSKGTIFRPNLHAAQLLMSRVALYTKQYAQAAVWSTRVIEQSGRSLYALENYKASSNVRFIDGSNPEILFTYGAKERARLSSMVSASSTSKGNFKVSTELMKLYSSKDKRLEAFFRKVSTNRYKPFKFYEHGSKDVLAYTFHLSEAYLNRAEAYAQQGQTAQAVADLNALRAKRISQYVPVALNDAQEALTEIKNERRKELCFEGHRWFDLRRWGRPALKHVYTSNTNASDREEFTLEEGDKRYTLPAPQEERLQNSNL